MAPVFAAPNAYLSRVGPKPLGFSAPTRPLEEILAKLPPLPNGLPEKPAPELEPKSQQTIVEPGPLGPVFPEPEPAIDSIRLPDPWPTVSPGTPTTGETPPTILPLPNGSSSAGQTQISLSPENLIRFFIRQNPGQTNSFQPSTSVAIPVPFIPGTPTTPTSSSVQFRQD
jgi:hypothetical protein